MAAQLTRCVNFDALGAICPNITASKEPRPVGGPFMAVNADIARNNRPNGNMYVTIKQHGGNNAFIR
jgi:hypothetical protein